MYIYIYTYAYVYKRHVLVCKLNRGHHTYFCPACICSALLFIDNPYSDEIELDWRHRNSINATADTYFAKNRFGIISNAATCFLLGLLLLLRSVAFGCRCRCRCRCPKSKSPKTPRRSSLLSPIEPKSMWEAEGAIIDFLVFVLSVCSLAMHLYNAIVDSPHKMLQMHRVWYHARIFEASRSILLINVARLSTTTNILILTIFKAVPKFLDVLIVWCFFIVIWSVVFVQLYSHKFWHCDFTGMNATWQRFVQEEVGLTKQHHTWLSWKRTHVSPDENSTGALFWTRKNCTDYGGTWVNRESNFDNLGQAFLTLFHMSTMEGWVAVMRYATDVVGIDKHPIQDFAFETGFISFGFYILTIILSSNLFVSAFIQSFDQTHAEIDGWWVNGLCVYIVCVCACVCASS